jgi:bifunctional ADP-heptose synthase (sugar kinase/adenylyltransferase)
VRPHVYCKGLEYSRPDADVTGRIRDDVEAVRRVGGEVRYVGSVVFSSSKLLNAHFESRDPAVTEFCRRVARASPPAAFRQIVDDFAGLRVLIVGDIIFDRYTTVQVQGLTSKSRILSGRYVGEDFQAGGALAAFRHVREFTPHVRLASLVGTEPWVDARLGAFIAPAEQLIVRSPGFTTVVKQRYIEPREEGKELAKLFSVNFIDARHPGEDLQREVLGTIAAAIEESDVVMAREFGHGLLGDLVRDHVQDKARFLAVNCQTNSNNHGFNILNRRYRRADAFSLDETEITLAMGRQHVEFPAATAELRRSLGARYGWLTRGSVETLGCGGDGAACACPPFERRIVDTLGAGDAFFSVAALAAARGLPLETCTFMGQLAGAQAVTVVGNAEPIRKARFLKGAASMLAF